ncbi:MAG: AAA family ATPase [Bacteroidota bacterium]
MSTIPPINSAYLAFKDRPKEFEEVLQLFRGLFGAALKSNPYLKQGLITGILRIAKANLLSDLNNLSEYTLLDETFAASYGFTQEEVDELLDKVPTRTDRAAIQHWYNGYTFGGEILYNPWSIMCCLARKGKLGHYWLDSGGTDLIDSVLLSDKRQEDLQTLVSGERITSLILQQVSFEDLEEPVGLYSLLLFSGYLNPAVVPEAQDTYRLSIPNYEVQYIYEQRLLRWVANRLQIDPNRYYSLARLLAVGQVLEFETTLRELLHLSASFHQTGAKLGEVFYSGFMLCLLSILSPSYQIESERESGLGRADVLLIPRAAYGRDQALVVEYKVVQEVSELAAVAEAGLWQISTKGYGTHAKSHAHVKKLLQVCLAFCGKEVALQYEEIVL